MAIETPIVEWAIDQLTKSPPMQSIVAVIIVLLLALPLIRGALKAVHHAPPQHPPVIQETPWLITTLTGIQIRVDHMHEKQDKIAEAMGALQTSATDILRRQETIVVGLAALTKLLRKRQNRRG